MIVQRVQQFAWLLMVLVVLPGCFKRLPDKHQVYFNDFESGSQQYLTVVNHFGTVDSSKIVSFNHNKVFGFFNNNRIEFKVDQLPEHNTVKIEFDLLIHDKWNGDFLTPVGNTVPDAWQMILDGAVVYITTFSNGPHGQSFPANYVLGNPSNPPRANSWNSNLPGACALQSSPTGSTLYKIELTTAHTASSVFITCNDALQPFNSFCDKSWSIDNLRLTAIKYN